MPKSKKRERDGADKTVIREVRRSKRRRRSVRSIMFTGIAVMIAILVIASFVVTALPAPTPSNTNTGDDWTDISTTVGAQVGNHWHAPVSVEICDTQIMLPKSDGDVHSHGDGSIHIHPTVSATTGSNANLGSFFDSLGMIVKYDKIQPPGDKLYTNGTQCPDGEAGDVQVLVNNEDITDTFTNYVLNDGDRVIVFFK